MTVVIPQWLFDHMVEKFGQEEAERTLAQLGIRVDRESYDESNQNPQGGVNGLG